MSQQEETPSFKSLGLRQEVLDVVEALGYKQPTPLQQEVIPAAIRVRDVACVAEPGSGRTAAFLLSLLHRLVCTDRYPYGYFCVIVVPTRERAAKVVEVIDRMARTCKWLTSHLLVEGMEGGWVPMSAGNVPNILVGTPRCLAAHAKDIGGPLGYPPRLVVDEADKIVEMGAALDLQPIVRVLSRRRATMMFSTTMSTEVEELRDVLLRDTVRIIKIGQKYTAVDTRFNFYYLTSPEYRDDDIMDILDDFTGSRVVVFTTGLSDSRKLGEKLVEEGYDVITVNEEMSQRETVVAVEQFKSWWGTVLVATNAVSRRLDNLGVDAVINCDCPLEPEDYMCRVNHSAGSRNRAVITIVTTDTFGDMMSMAHKMNKKLEVYCQPMMERHWYDQRRARALRATRAWQVEQRREME